MPDNYARLSRLMQARRLALGMKTWRDLSAKAGISYETLRALRTGRNPSDATSYDLETALQWKHGSIDRILAGGDPTPVEQTVTGPARPEPAAPNPLDGLPTERGARLEALFRLSAEYGRLTKIVLDEIQRLTGSRPEDQRETG